LMMRNTRFAALLICLCWAFNVSAVKPENPVMLTDKSITAPDAYAGDTLTVNVTLTVVHGYHVNANPAATEDYIPLEITLQDTLGLHAEKPLYPKGKKWRLEGTTEDLLVYDGDVNVKVPVVVDTQTKPGERVVKGSIDYQACNDQVCFMPETRLISVKIHILEKK
jgi:hypothetical protein